MVNIDPAAWLELGLEFVGFYERRQKVRYKTNLERFTSHYGASPETLQAIFNDFQTTDIDDAHIARPDPMLLLMATFWLRTYAKETQLAGTFKVDDKTAREYVRKYVKAIAALKGLKVSVGAKKCDLVFYSLTNMLVLLLDYLDRFL